MIPLGTGFVYVNNKKETFTLYKTGSAEKHKTSDDVTLKTALIKALNAPDRQKQDQGGGVVRYKINDGKGYLVYKTPVNDVPNTAAIFHYHWNYNLDLPLTAT